MGGSRPNPPQIIYPPSPPPPAPPTQVPSQSLQTQTALNEVSGKQQRLNMELGAQLDRTNADFFASQDIRRTQAAGAEQRLSYGEVGDQTRATTRVQGQENRAGIAETGLQYRRGIETSGQQERETTRVKGQEARDLTRTTGQETRMTDLQKEMFRRYKENRDYEQAQQQYRT